MTRDPHRTKQPADQNAGGTQTIEPVQAGIRRAVDRLESAVHHKPGFGHSTGQSVTELVAGLLCESSEGDHRIRSDLSAALGGSGAAPTPGALLRAALGSCLAMGYQLRAAQRGLELTAVRVTVETDSEIAGMLMCDAAAPPGFTEIRCHVEVESSASTAEIEQIIEEGDRLSPIIDAITRANVVHRSVSIRSDGA